MRQGLRSCFMFCFKGSSSGGSVIFARRNINELEKVVRTGAQSFSCIEWLFIPPRSPNFGGLLEVAVKSMEHHLRRVIENFILTYEERTLIPCQIEQVLNNRPLMTLKTIQMTSFRPPRQC